MRILLLFAIAAYTVDLFSSLKVNVFGIPIYAQRSLGNSEMSFSQLHSSTGNYNQVISSKFGTNINARSNNHNQNVQNVQNAQNDVCKEKSFSKNKCIAENGCVWTGEECKRLGVA